MLSDFTIFPKNIGFCFESFLNTILASHHASFLQNTMSSSNFFFLSPLPLFTFLGVDFGVWILLDEYPNFLMVMPYLKHHQFQFFILQIWYEFNDPRR
jgi:hypothetical protein